MFNTKISLLKEKHNEEVKKLRSEITRLQEELDNTQKRYVSYKAINDNEVEMRIAKETKRKEDQINQLKLDNGILAEKVNILEKAFENMGFDVKDMKSILGRLVDGIVSGNKINILK